ncbi:hypothetical protein ZWY2020_058292 [Hordeum vulgare]|nr:hypothetical protein ZWY2020_039892 [Hordeum vulgare]KAI5021562.1 hypothetical protein ZWY2020_058292 [Hordeum vulgare]
MNTLKWSAPATRTVALRQRPHRLARPEVGCRKESLSPARSMTHLEDDLVSLMLPSFPAYALSCSPTRFVLSSPTGRGDKSPADVVLLYSFADKG